MSKIRANDLESLDGLSAVSVKDLSTVTLRPLYANSIAELPEPVNSTTGQVVLVSGNDSGTFEFDGTDWVRKPDAYDNSTSGLNATDVQSAIDEVASGAGADPNPATEILGTGPYIIAATGQSNMVGRCPGGTFKINPAVKIWNIDNQEFEVADFANVTYNLDMGTGDVAGGGDNNAAIAFCHKLQEETGEDVYLILNARGGASITNWDTGTFTTTLKSTIASALADPSAPGKTSVDMLLWLQGEKDLQDGMDYDVYGGHFENFVNSMDAESYFDKATAPIITAPIPRFYIYESGPFYKPDVQEFLGGLGNQYLEKYGRTAVANPLNLTNCDVSHYDGASLYELGYNRFYESFLKINAQGNVGAPPLMAFQAGGGTGVTELGDGTEQNFVLAGDGQAQNFSSVNWGSFNIGIGENVYRFTNTVGEHNVGFGTNAFRQFSSVGDTNTYIGNAENTDMVDSNNPAGVMGSANVIVGNRNGGEATIGDGNTFVGKNIAVNITNIGNENVAYGAFALGGNAVNGDLGTGNVRHTAIGPYSLGNLNTDSGTGQSNTALGSFAGYNLQNASAMASAQNVTCLGYNSSVSGNNQVQLGNSSTTTYAYGAVQDRSDERDKLDVQAISDDLIKFFMEVEWRQFRMDYRDAYVDLVDNEDGSVETVLQEKDGSRAGTRFHIGAIAQQVEATMKKYNVDFAGLQHHSVKGGLDIYTIGYQEFIGLQGEIIQRQQKKMQSIEDRLEAAGI